MTFTVVAFHKYPEGRPVLDTLIKFYGHYPEVLFSLKRVARGSLDPTLVSELDFHGQQQRKILNLAQVYQLDEPAEMMLRSLSAQMQHDGLDSMFSEVRLPFPQMLLTLPGTSTDASPAALISQVDGCLYTQVYHAQNGGLLPNLLVFRSQGASVEVIPSPTFTYAKAVGDDVTMDAAIKQEKNLCFGFLSMAVGMAVLFEHKAMLEREETVAYSRAERRRAEKSGHSLPNNRKIKIKLGELGRRQLQATQGGTPDEDSGTTKRRAHWVQGHFMRNRAGGISWRNPHVRGAGPIIEQERYISFIDEAEED